MEKGGILQAWLKPDQKLISKFHCHIFPHMSCGKTFSTFSTYAYQVYVCPALPPKISTFCLIMSREITNHCEMRASGWSSSMSLYRGFFLTLFLKGKKSLLLSLTLYSRMIYDLDLFWHSISVCLWNLAFKVNYLTQKYHSIFIIFLIKHYVPRSSARCLPWSSTEHTACKPSSLE